MKFSVLFPLALATGATVFAQEPAKPAAPSAAKPKAAAAPGRPATAKPAASAKSATPAATDSSKVVLTVGNEKITENEFNTFIDSLPEQYRAQARGPMKRQVAEQVVRVKMLAAEAKKQGLDKDPVFVARARFQLDNLMAGAAFNDLQNKVVVDDAAMQKYYNEHKNEYESVKARHILIRFKGSPVPTREGQADLSEEESLKKVQDLRAKIAAGADFAALAKAESDDTGSGANGGDLGQFTRGQMVPQFEEVAFKLQPGTLSEPVKTQFGYHLIQVEAHETKTLDSLKEEIAAKLKPDTARQAVEDLRKSVTVTFDDAYFGPAEAPAAPAPAPAKP